MCPVCDACVVGSLSSSSCCVTGGCRGLQPVVVNWAEFAQEFPVPKCDSARSVNLDCGLVVLSYLNDTTGLVPFVWMRSCLILHAD